jgi:hypothetical protein
MYRVRSCSVCGESFEAPRTTGRPPERCSEECRRIAQRAHHRNYMRRLIEARRQIDALQAA